VTLIRAVSWMSADSPVSGHATQPVALAYVPVIVADTRQRVSGTGAAPPLIGLAAGASATIARIAPRRMRFEETAGMASPTPADRSRRATPGGAVCTTPDRDRARALRDRARGAKVAAGSG